MTRREIAPAALAVVAAVLAVYLPALDASFQFDDFNVVVRDARVQSLGAWAASMPGIRPLLKLSYALNHELGAGVRGFRAVNVLIHAGNALLVLALLRRRALAQGLCESRARAVALIAALLFALHPLQTEAVTYVSGRSSSLVALCSLGALLAWLRSFDASAHAAGWRVLTLLLVVAAFAVKETAVALPLAFVAWAWTLPHTDAGANAVLRRQLQSLLPVAIVCLGVATLLACITPYGDLLRASLGVRDPWQNLLTQSHAVPYLLGKLVCIDQLNADPDLAPVLVLDAGTGLRLLLLAATLLTALAGRRYWPSFGFAVLWCGLWLLPTNSIFAREDIANDRQLYTALIGPAFLLAVLMVRGAEALHGRLPPPTARAIAIIVAAVLCGSLGAATVDRNRVYRSEVSYWQDAARRSPGKARTANNLGYAYALVCRDAAALAEFARAAALDPADSRARVNRRLLEEGALFRDGERRCR